jgi:hypothetical protein
MCRAGQIHCPGSSAGWCLTFCVYELFQVERAFQQARVPVILSVDLTLVHDSNDWATLPPLIVSVHRMKRPNTVKILLKGALSRTPSFRPGLSVKAPKGPGSSKMAGFLGSNSPKVLGGDGAVGMVEDEHATEELWTGQISLEDVMQQVFMCAKVACKCAQAPDV